MSASVLSRAQRHRLRAGLAHLRDRIETLNRLAKTMRPVAAVGDDRAVFGSGVARTAAAAVVVTGASAQDADSWQDPNLTDGAGEKEASILIGKRLGGALNLLSGMRLS